MLRLVQQVGRQEPGVGTVVGNDQALAGAEEHGRHRPVTLHLDLGTSHGRAAGADNFAHLGHRLGAESESSDTGRAIGPEDVADAELGGHHEHSRVGDATRPGYGRDHHGDGGHTGDHGGRAQLDEDGRVRSLAAGHEKAGAGDRSDLFAHCEPGFAFEAPVPSGDNLLIEATHVVDGVADGRQQFRRHRRPGLGKLLIADPQATWVDVAAVVFLQRPGHCRVAVEPYVLQEGADLLA